MNLFTSKDKISFYFLKKLKREDLQNHLIYQTRLRATLPKLEDAKTKLNTDLHKNEINFLSWKQALESGIKEVQIFKIPFLNSLDVTERNPWRVCPVGEHWVRRHPKHLSSGKITDHDGHCRRNKTRRDILMADEIDLISNHELFTNPKVKVSANNLKFEYGNKYDDLISGWTAYWNDIFKLKNPLPPNVVKALLATESSFKPGSSAENSPLIGQARGLMQITEVTYRYLNGDKRELKDHLVILSEEELWEPNKNIAAGVRWIFRKYETTKARLKKEPDWVDVSMDYKGRLTSKTTESKKIRLKIQGYLKQLGDL